MREKAPFVLFAVLWVTLFLGCAGKTNNTPATDSLALGDYSFELVHDGIPRFYLVHVPPTYDGKPTPLVLAFHGGTGSAQNMSENYFWREKSDEEGFLVAFPNGASRFSSGKFATWNAGNCCGYAVESQSDDIGFVESVISDLQKKATIGAVFATGMSNGGMLTHRLACEKPELFSAVAAVAGTNNFEDCNPSTPVSVTLPRLKA